MFKLGLPIGFGIFIELSMFSGAQIILGILGEDIVEPVKLKSPTETVPNDKTPDPFVCKTWFALPSAEGNVKDISEASTRV